jgi:hypothetical protein
MRWWKKIMPDKAVIRLEEHRARIPDKELAYYETVITLALDIIYALKPVVHRIPVDDLDLILQAMMSAKFIRDRTVREMEARKRAVKGE